MNIILDSNILVRDIKLSNENIEIILDYLDKTNSSVILPKIVIEEIKNLYGKNITEKLSTYEKAETKLKSVLVNSLEFAKITVDLEKESNDYIKFVMEKLKVKEEQIIKYKNEYLPELVNRAVNKLKPLGENGQQFRDGLLWLTTMDYAETVENKEIIFISSNTKDFASNSSGRLDEQLQKELDERGIRIHFYKDIESFVKNHASKIDFINKEWISGNIEKETLEKMFIYTIGEYHKEKAREEVDLNRNERLTGYVRETNYINSDIDSYYVYEKQDGKLLLRLQVIFETEFELEIERIIEKEETRYDHRLVINPRTGKQEYEVEYIPDYSLDYQYDIVYSNPVFEESFTVIIDDRKITEIKLTD